MSGFDTLPAELAPAAPARPRVLVVGTALAATGVALAFFSILGVYLGARAEVVASGEAWLPRGVTIPLTQPNFMAMTLTLSLITAFWATRSAGNDDRTHTMYAVGLTLLFGGAYLAQTLFLLDLMNMGAADDRRNVLIYAVIGAHVAIALAAIAYFSVMGIRAALGEFRARNTDGLSGAALFWAVMVVLYYALWYAVYITK